MSAVVSTEFIGIQNWIAGNARIRFKELCVL